MAGQGGNGGGSDIFRISGADFRKILPAVFRGIGYDQIHIEDNSRRAFADKTTKSGRGYYDTSSRTRVEVGWDFVPGRDGALRIAWSAFDASRPDYVPRPDLARKVEQSLRQAIADWQRPGKGPRGPEAPPHDKVVGPGEAFDGNYTGTLRDYSGCATQAELRDLASGVLPLGKYAYNFASSATPTGKTLYLSKFRNSGRMEYNGVLVCAPQNSGKTTLLERWAEAATRAPKPYCVLVIDVKGNMRRKLEERNLAGEIYCFSTDPHDTGSDRINFLAGPMGLNAVETDRIRQIATALLPSRGFVERGGLDEYHYRNRVIWLTAFIHLLKLEQVYYPERFTDDQGRQRTVDLADLYQLIADEERVYALITSLIDGEKKLRARGETLPLCGAEHWASELALMLNPQRIGLGQRPEKDSFRSYTTGILTALEPFSAHGTLHHRIRSFGAGRLFDLESALGGTRRPVTVILAARQQDLEKSDAVLAMAIKRIQWLLFDRMTQPDAENRPLLLLLDETRRIVDFNTADYIAFAREAKAACVVVYQALDQIGDATHVTALLENVGTQVYLGSLVGNTARYFAGILPKRARDVVSRQTVQVADTETKTLMFNRETVDYLSSMDLYHLPAGEWPALVYINDQPRRKPFLVDMTDPLRSASVPTMAGARNAGQRSGADYRPRAG